MKRVSYELEGHRTEETHLYDMEVNMACYKVQVSMSSEQSCR